MKQLIEVMKRVALNAVETTKPVEVCFGTVQSEIPLRIRISQKQVLEKEFFLIRDGVTTSSFETGDILILLRVQGGQQYYIIGKKGEW